MNKTDVCKITVSEKPRRVTVVHGDTTHKANWTDNGAVYNVKGNKWLLNAAMLAWEGKDTFEATLEELNNRSDGWGIGEEFDELFGYGKFATAQS